MVYQGRVVVDLDRPIEAEGFVRPSVVEDLPVGLCLPVQIGQGLDLHPVQVLVLQRLERALAYPVSGPGCAAGYGCATAQGG